MKVRIIRDGPYWYKKGEEHEVGVDPSAYFTLQNPTRWIRKDDCEILCHEERGDKQVDIQPYSKTSHERQQILQNPT